MRIHTIHLMLAAALVCVAGEVRAQLDRSTFVSTTSTAITTSNYYFAKPNEITITVNVVGFVVRPGRYEISKSIDLVNVLSLAGGATSEGTLSDVVIQRIVDTPGGSRVKELELNLEDLSSLGPADLALSPGDVIAVGRSGWDAFKDVFSVAVGGATIVIAIAYLALALED